MADLVQTAASVIVDATSAPQTVQGAIAGEAITAGQPIYQTNAAAGSWFKALAGGNALQAGGQTKIAIATTSAPGAGQPVVPFVGGKINLGGTLVAGQTYALSHNSGAIFNIADLATNDYVTILGVAVNTSYIQTPSSGSMFASNAQHA